MSSLVDVTCSYCIETSTPINLAFFILKRMEKTRFKPKELLPYGMLLTRLFKHVVSVSPELAFDHYLSHDRAMHLLAPHYERKTRANRCNKTPRESNDTYSSTTQNHPSSFLSLGHMVDKNDDESFHSNSSSPSQQLSPSSNVASRVRQNPSHESHDLNTLLSETITFQAQQRNAHGGTDIRSLDKLSRKMMGGKKGIKNCGIVSQLSPPRTPQLNGVAERRNRTLLDMVRSMMCQATLPISFWGYTLETAAHILNLVPTKKVLKTPFEMWKGERPSLGHIKIWGCEVFVRREAQDKLKARSEKCLFDSESKIDLEEIQESADEEPIVNTDTQQEVVTPIEPDDISLPIRRKSNRVSKPSHDPQFYYDFHIEEDKISDSTLIDLNEPANYKEAMACPEAAKWKEAMKSEIQSMYDNQVWKLVDTTPGLKIVGYKWIFKKKTCMDGKVHTYKARLVAKGCTQTHGIDYEETFSPVAKIKSIRIMLAIAAFHDFEIWQMDVKTAFFNEKLTKDVGSVVVFLVLYVDDILLIGNDIPTLQSVKEWLGKCFAMKDLGDAAYVLGIKIYRDRTRRLIGLSQDTYLDKSLKRFKMENSKKGNLPLHHGIKISSDLCPKTDDELDKMSRVLYASAIGSIMYDMTCTRPDVSFALRMVSRHQQNPGEGHWTSVKNILKYLRNTKDMFLVYGGEKELRVTGYCDAGWQTDKDDSRSQSGWIFLLNGGAVTWKSSKQDTVADSTCESEYIAACEASKEAIWMKNFIGDLGVVPTVQDPIEIFCDNESAVALTKEPKDHGKSKHIDRKYHFVRSKVAWVSLWRMIKLRVQRLNSDVLCSIPLFPT
ncbi:retrotransposon protein, putative, ty1-copia subclass [Tanacetum coccineum]|uniref:Retrotransposon protein, putative, ty1-copia subclass n=1 Tax=Tanacetum coccineum TaxID=301880 RepID=A0ABQ5CPL0_9ASTR